MFVANKRRRTKPVSFSAINEMKLKLFSKDSNSNGMILGSKILDVAIEYAKKVADKHAESNCIALGIDFLRFFNSAKREDVLILDASINKVWEKTLEVGVKISAIDFLTLEKKRILSAYFIFKKCDIDDNKRHLDLLLVKTKEEKRRYSQAEKRKSKNSKYLYTSS